MDLIYDLGALRARADKDEDWCLRPVVFQVHGQSPLATGLRAAFEVDEGQVQIGTDGQFEEQEFHLFSGFWHHRFPVVEEWWIVSIRVRNVFVRSSEEQGATRRPRMLGAAA